jgi:hypothetical protein
LLGTITGNPDAVCPWFEFSTEALLGNLSGKVRTDVLLERKPKMSTIEHQCKKRRTFVPFASYVSCTRISNTKTGHKNINKTAEVTNPQLFHFYLHVIQ